LASSHGARVYLLANTSVRDLRDARLLNTPSPHGGAGRAALGGDHAHDRR